jgi:hypothetical protein
MTDLTPQAELEDEKVIQAAFVPTSKVEICHRVVVTNTADRVDRAIAEVVAESLLDKLLKCAGAINMFDYAVDNNKKMTDRFICVWSTISNTGMGNCVVDAPENMVKHIMDVLLSQWEELPQRDQSTLSSVEISIIACNNYDMLNNLEAPAKTFIVDMDAIEERNLRMLRIQISIKTSQ